MKSLVYILPITLLLILPPTVWAGAETGFYLGGSVGSAEVDYSSETDLSAIDLDDDTSALKVFAGFNFGFLPLLDFALEGSYVDFGEVSTDITGGTASLDLTGIDGFGLVGVKLGAIGLFAKTGLIRWESETNVAGGRTEDSGTDSVSGIGVRFQLWSIAVRVEYEEFDIENADIALYSVGASWTF